MITLGMGHDEKESVFRATVDVLVDYLRDDSKEFLMKIANVLSSIAHAVGTCYTSSWCFGVFTVLI